MFAVFAILSRPLTSYSMRVRAGLVSVIYKKALVLSNDERSRATGDIVNLMSVDATRLQDLCTYGLISISGPLQVNNFSVHIVGLSHISRQDHSCIYFTVQSIGLGCFCWCGHHDRFDSIEYMYGFPRTCSVGYFYSPIFRHR